MRCQDDSNEWQQSKTGSRSLRSKVGGKAVHASGKDTPPAGRTERFVPQKDQEGEAGQPSKTYKYPRYPQKDRLVELQQRFRANT